jgi:hypothetical protein
MWQWLRQTLGGTTKGQHAELLARYHQLRQAEHQLTRRLIATLPKSVLDEGGKKLGALRKNARILDAAGQVDVLMDYCVHEVRREGLNAVERYLVESPPPAASDELVLLQAMRQTRYSLFAVEGVEPGLGAHLRDLLRDETLFVVDVGLSSTAPAGMLLTARIMSPEGITAITGAGVPVGALSGPERARLLQRLRTALQGTDFRQLPPGQAGEWTATVILTCAQGGGAWRGESAEPGVGGARARPAAERPPVRRVGRNQACPCGSRKKFKQCCGKSRP